MAAQGIETDAIHANYWLSGVAGHVLKHELDLPLISTFHTLDRVKAEASPEELVAAEPARRAQAEAEVIPAVPTPAWHRARSKRTSWSSCTRPTPNASRSSHRAWTGRSSRPATTARPGGRWATRPAAPLLLFVGRIQPLKALGVAVQALDHLVHGPARSPARYGRAGGSGPLERATLVAVGGPSGPHGQAEMARVRHLAEAAWVWAITSHLVPPQGHERLSTYYRAADVVIVPSRSESFGLVALEASACGIPVVASAVGGLTTLVDHGRTGYLVDERDPKVFADYIAHVLRDGELARAMSAAAVLRARGYTWSGAGARLRRRYAELTSRSLVQCR